MIAAGNGATASLLSAHGFQASLITRLVNSGLAMAAPEKVMAGGRTIEVLRIRITDKGRKALKS